MIVRYSKNKVVFYTRESILPANWEKETQRAKPNKELPEFNTRLDNLEATAKDIFRRYQNDNSHKEPSPNEYKKLLETAIKGTKSGVPTTLIKFIQYFIEETKQNKKNSLAGSYNQTLNCIKDFAKDKNKRVDFDTMNNNFNIDFVEYLETKKHYKLNNIGKHIKNLKRFLNEASIPEINVNKFLFYKRFKVVKEDADTIYLNEDELQASYYLDLSNNTRLERVRDLFLVGCWTGLRFSDFTTIHAKDITDEFIYIQTQKTGQKVVIPIHKTVKAIMNKYKDQFQDSLPPKISNQKFNLYLKEIGKKLEILKIKWKVLITQRQEKKGTRKYDEMAIIRNTYSPTFLCNQYV